MNDTISRSDAIDTVEFGITYAKAIDVNTGESKELFKEGNDALKKAIERLKELPSAERTGKWVEGHRSGFNGVFYWYRECDQCGYEREDDDSDKDSVYKYCPNCGARMVSE